MGNIQIYSLRVGEVVTNCYICVNTKNNDCFVVDPGDESERIVNFLKVNKLNPQAILLTHGHFDHIGAVSDIKREFGIPVYASALEEKVLTDPGVNLSSAFGYPYMLRADKYLNDEAVFFLADFKIKMISTPGHTCGSCCYYLEEENIIFSGDTLFAASRGRTDFPTGSERALLNSIRTKLLILPENTVVYAGHMEQTTIGDERMYY